MQIHSKAQEQALMHLKTQYETAVASIRNNEKLTEVEKQKALEQEKNQYHLKKKGLQGSLFSM